jgi:hypothetical protein
MKYWNKSEPGSDAIPLRCVYLHKVTGICFCPADLTRLSLIELKNAEERAEETFGKEDVAEAVVDWLNSWDVVFVA